ncbi:hypothetical protein EPIR_1405 [Erwinia piriflorinigrans CFBP 5888]|uniref:Uncharacterized protein n=1 Tax=Erwinia piriflorinigrans CFBP 5888 TaxID=1161919 RepID=V5Z6W4_9GAMM|nr:hypothetical protein EPIR_1405 [Erwinia piriflorinigrans CFBP 5888]
MQTPTILIVTGSDSHLAVYLFINHALFKFDTHDETLS